jgi:hypothetical protein
MRLKSGLWVRAYVRRCAGEGAMAAIARRGSEEAGAIFIKIDLLDGRALLFAPAPAGMEAEPDRLWHAPLGAEPVASADADIWLGKQARFDEDLWIVEIEDRLGRHFLDGALSR